MLLRSLGSFTTLHVVTLLMGWGGVGDRCVQKEISWIVVFKKQKSSLVCQVLAMAICQWTQSPPAKDDLDAETPGLTKDEKGSCTFLPKTQTKRKFGQICAPKFGQIWPIKLCVSL